MDVDINPPELSKDFENTELENIEDSNSNTKNDDRTFEVDEILAHRFDVDKLRFLVRWKGFGPDEGAFYNLTIRHLGANDKFLCYASRTRLHAKN
jgi:hypothetical protein